MREIKFRAWDKTYKKMYHTGFWVSATYPNSDGDICFDPKIFKPGHYGALGLEIMQYTGLKDKNGKEIYEGDIVNFTGIVTAPNDSFGKTYEEKCVIEFDTGCFKPFNSPYSNGESCEIIGNIYENPELFNRHC